MSGIVDNTQVNPPLIGVDATSLQIGAVTSDPFTYPVGLGVGIFPDAAAVANLSPTTLLDTLLRTYNKNTNPIPSDITKFVQDFVAQATSTQPPDQATVNAVLTAFLQAYQMQISNSPTPDSSGAWPELSSSISLTGNINDPNQFAQLEAAWKSFTSQFPYTSTGNVGVITSPTSDSLAFFNAWRAYTTVSATIDGTNPSVSSYVQIFNSFNPAYANTVDPSSPTGQTYFAENLQQFYKAEVQRYGYFSPSNSLTDWIGFTQKLAGLTLPPTTRVPETKTKIIDNVMLLLIQMITSTQNIAAVQADRLALYSSWQRGYTSLLGNIHVFTANSPDRLSGTDSATTTVRQDTQTNFNSSVTQRVTSQQSVLSDDSKSLQSRVNASSDAFNDQANTVTSLLQELSTLLSSIVKS